MDRLLITLRFMIGMLNRKFAFASRCDQSSEDVPASVCKAHASLHFSYAREFSTGVSARRPTGLGAIISGFQKVFGRLCAAAALAAVGFFAQAASGTERVDLEIVFAADGSGSIDDDELLLQRKGYADALSDRRVLDAIASGQSRRIAVTYIEWGDKASQHVIVGWTQIASAGDAAAFGAALLAAPRAAWGYNSISEAIAFSTDLILGNAYEGERKVIDVSGDGPQIGGRPLEAMRDRAVDHGITINALAVKSRGGHVRSYGGVPLETHYQLDVIGGLGAFVMVADESTSFAEVLLAKIIREIADARPTGKRLAARAP